MKRVLCAVLTALLWSQGMPAAHAAEPVKPASSGVEVSAKSVILMERETGTVLYQQAEHEQREPASVTKIMTMLLVVEAIEQGQLHLEDRVTCSAYAASMGGSQVFLAEGEQMSVHDLLKSVAVASGNDAAVALAEQIAGSESAFVEKMNRRAQELGMKDTHFCNCNGLPAEGHVTSAYDIALMSRQLLQYDLIRDYVGIWMDSIREGTFQLANTNKLIYYYDGATGLKTGSTDAAGYCISATAERGGMRLIASAQREGMELIAVVLGSPTSKERFNTAKALLNYGFGAYALADVTPEQPLPALPVQLGQAEQVELALAQTGKLLVKKEERSKVTSELQLEQALKAPVSQGQEVGKLVVSVDGKERMTIPVVTQTQVPRLTFSGMFGSLWRRMATGK